VLTNAVMTNTPKQTLRASLKFKYPLFFFFICRDPITAKTIGTRYEEIQATGLKKYSAPMIYNTTKNSTDAAAENKPYWNVSLLCIDEIFSIIYFL
jgi:hypothetical protein